MPTIQDGDVTLDITLLQPPAPGSAAPPSAGSAFLQWWRAECKTRNLGGQRFSGADHKIASRLSHKHGLQRLKKLAVNYFRRHYAEHAQMSPMIIFSAQIPTIETELKEQAP